MFFHKNYAPYDGIEPSLTRHNSGALTIELIRSFIGKVDNCSQHDLYITELSNIRVYFLHSECPLTTEWATHKEIKAMSISYYWLNASYSATSQYLTKSYEGKSMTLCDLAIRTLLDRYREPRLTRHQTTKTEDIVLNDLYCMLSLLHVVSDDTF